MFELLKGRRESRNFQNTAELWLEVLARSHADLSPVKTRIRSWVRILGSQDIGKITPMDVQRVYLARDNGERSAAYLNRERMYFRQFWRWCKGLDLVKHDPTAAWPRVRGPRRRVYIKIDRGWLPLMEEHLNSVYSRFIYVAFYTGLRVGEIRVMRWSWLGRLPGSGLEALEIPAWARKTGRAHVLPLSSSARAALGKEGPSEALVIPGLPGNSSINRALKMAAARAGLPPLVKKHISCHQFRRSWATALLNLGMPRLMVQKIGGWATLDMVEGHYYSGFDIETASEFLEKL